MCKGNESENGAEWRGRAWVSARCRMHSYPSIQASVSVPPQHHGHLLAHRRAFCNIHWSIWRDIKHGAVIVLIYNGYWNLLRDGGGKKKSLSFPTFMRYLPIATLQKHWKPWKKWDTFAVWVLWCFMWGQLERAARLTFCTSNERSNEQKRNAFKLSITKQARHTM